ncbi:putative choline transporter [Aspergillus ambiguus]|uniref:putative choline transporter n=1 Tax=Aspergillus ambiguus TaxID=176160 RepID=UPI003CCD58BA
MSTASWTAKCDDKYGKEKHQAEGLDETVELEILGLSRVIERNLNTFKIICGGWNICNSWAGIVGTLAIGIAQGGTVLLLYGIIITLVAVGCCACTLAEMACVYPTAGGQYHWTSILSPRGASRVLSYCCGAVNIFSWISISAGVTILPAEFIMAMASFNNSQYESHRWQYFLIYQATNIAILLYNIFGARRTSWVHDLGFGVSLASFLAILIACLALSPQKQTSGFVWTTFINDSGWPSDAIAFLTGLINPHYIYAGIDGAVHLAEECSNASTAVPYALMSTVIIGFATSLPFVVAMLYTVTDLNSVIGASVPIYEIWIQATRSDAVATFFVSLLVVIALFALNGCQQTASRLTWAFARDDAVIMSGFLSRVHHSLQVPVYALVANAGIIFVIGCIYLASSTAFNALIGTGLILQQVSFMFPAALLLYRHRSTTYLPSSRHFRLGWFGWVANIITILFGVITLVFYCFPAEFPVTGGNMNYSVVVIGIMAIFTLVNWFVHANRNYEGPRLPVELTHH